ncbi:MAG: 50S ribosomal protein L18Ae [Candidatus Anstonellaceae archaeon]
MAKYLVRGMFRKGKTSRKFQKEVEAASEKLAREYIYAMFGSRGGIKRSAITISSIEKI